MLPFYQIPYKNAKKYKNQMSHHLRYFRFSNRTHIELKEELQMEQFFAERPDSETSEDSVRIAGPIRTRADSAGS